MWIDPNLKLEVVASGGVGSLRRPEIRGANPLIVGTFGLLAKPSLCRKTCGPLAERQLPHSLHLMEEMTSMVAQAMNSVAGELIAIEIVIFFCGITIGWAVSTGRGGSSIGRDRRF